MLALSLITSLIYVTIINVGGDFTITFKKRTFMTKIKQLLVEIITRNLAFFKCDYQGYAIIRFYFGPLITKKQAIYTPR